jgi:hypothetical protein
VTTPRSVCFPDPVPDRASLYDRATALTDVLDSVRFRTTVILGGRLIGKTSLLNVVAQVTEEHGEFAMIRLPPADSRAELMAEILDGISQWVDKHGRDWARTPAEEHPVSTIAQFCQRIATLAEQATGVVFLLCVDEFDSLLQSWDARQARLVLELIGHLATMPGLPVRFLLTMSTIPDLMLHSFRSTILNQSKIVTLEAWDAEEAARFTEWLLGEQFIFDEAALAAIFDAAGGHPYFTKAVLNTLVTGLPYRPGSRYVSAARVAVAVREVARLPEVGLALQNLVGAHLSADAVAVLDRAGSSTTGVSGRSLGDQPSLAPLLASLRADSLLRQQGDRYVLRLGLWREWRAATQGFPVRASLLRRIGRVSRHIGLRHATSCVLLGGVAIPLAAALISTAYLAQERTIAMQPCGPSAAGLAVYAAYPAFASTGDRQQIEVTVVNNGPGDVDGSALLSFSAGQAEQNSTNGTAFTGLRPGEEATLQVGFTTTAPAGWLHPSRSHVGVQLAVSAGRACRTQHWSISVAPIPRLQLIQKVAVTAVVVFLVPLVVELAVRRFFPDGDGPRSDAGDPKDS